MCRDGIAALSHLAVTVARPPLRMLSYSRRTVDARHWVIRDKITSSVGLFSLSSLGTPQAHKEGKALLIWVS